MIPEPLQKLLQPEEAEREIVFADSEGDFIGIMLNHPLSGEAAERLKEVTLSLKQLEQVGTEETEDLVICLEAGEVLDCESLAEFKNLKTLAIYTRNPFKKDGCQVIHPEALAELPALSALSLYGVEVDLTEVEELPNLRELYLNYCYFQGTFGIQRLPRLRELSLYRIGGIWFPGQTCGGICRSFIISMEIYGGTARLERLFLRI